jgi:hypothetical protein
LHPVDDPSLASAWSQPLRAWKVKTRFQAFAFRGNLQRYGTATERQRGGALHVGIKFTHNP